MPVRMRVPSSKAMRRNATRRHSRRIALAPALQAIVADGGGGLHGGLDVAGLDTLITRQAGPASTIHLLAGQVSRLSVATIAAGLFCLRLRHWQRLQREHRRQTLNDARQLIVAQVAGATKFAPQDILGPREPRCVAPGGGGSARCGRRSGAIGASIQCSRRGSSRASNVRFTPNSGRRADMPGCRRSAISGREQMQQQTTLVHLAASGLERRSNCAPDQVLRIEVSRKTLLTLVPWRARRSQTSR
jgi:hypothetical protein